MNYLTYQEFIDFGYDLDEAEFMRLSKRATAVIHSLTNRFYVHNNFDNDAEWRKTAFKEALSAQVYHFHEGGGITSHALNTPSSVSIGRTSVSAGGGSNTSSTSIYSTDAVSLLEHTGLLYRGVVTR